MNELLLTKDELELLKTILFKISIDANLAKTLVLLQDKVVNLSRQMAPLKGDIAKNGSRH